MRLGCMIYTAPEVYGYNMWCMDEERVLGLKVCARHGFGSYTHSWQCVESQDDDRQDVVAKMTVLHFG